MPENPNNHEHDRDEKSSLEHQTEPPKPAQNDSTDPLGIKSVGGGVGVLILICGFLFIFAKLGQKGTDWLGDTVDSMLPEVAGVNGEVEDDSEVEDGGETDVEKDKEEPVAETKVVETVAQVPIPHTPIQQTKNQSARKQLLEQLGNKVEIRHIVFSRDESAMVASIRFINEDKSSKIEEVYFLRDENFPFFSPKEGSLIGKEIKVYFEE